MTLGWLMECYRDYFQANMHEDIQKVLNETEL